MATQWQYKVVTYQLRWRGFDYDEIEQRLNDLGREGWEMVEAIAPSFGAPGRGSYRHPQAGCLMARAGQWTVGRHSGATDHPREVRR